MRRFVVPCAVALLVAAVTLIIVDPALADAGGANAGPGKLGELFKNWAKWLIPGVAALVGVPAIARGDMGQVVGIVLVSLLLGAFAFMNAAQFETLVNPVLTALGG
jgi:hypothetical protein